MKRTALAGLALAVLVIGVYLMRGPLIFDPAAGAVEHTVRAAAGLDCRIDAMGGSLLRHVEVRGLALSGPDPALPYIDARAAKIRLEYRLWHLLGGLDYFLTRARLIILDADVTLATENRPATEDDEESRAADAQPPRLPVLPVVEIRNARWRLVDKGLSLDFSGIDLHPAGATGHYRLTVADGIWHASGRVNGRSRLEALLIGERDRLAIENLTADGRLLAPQLQAEWGHLPGRLPFGGTLVMGPGRLEIDGQLAGEMLTFDMAGRDLAPAQLVETLSPAAPIPLAGRIDLQAAAAIDLARPEDVQADGWVQATRGGWEDFKWERLRIEVQVERGRLALPRAEFSDGRNQLRLEAVSLPLAPLLAGKRSDVLADLTGRLSAEGDDLPAIMRPWGLAGTDRLPSVPAHRFAVRARATAGNVDLGPVLLSLAGGRVDIDHLVFSLPKLAAAPRKTAFSGAATIDVQDLAAVAALFGGPALQGRLDGRIQAHGTLAAPQAAARLHGRDMRVAGVPLGDAELALRGDGTRLFVDEAALRRGSDRLDLTGRLNLETTVIEAARLQWSLAEIAEYTGSWQAAAWQPRGSFSGDLQMQGPWDDPHIDLGFRLDRGAIGGWAVETAEGQGRGRLSRWALRRLEIKSVAGSLEMSGTLRGLPGMQPLDLALTQMDFRHNDVRLALAPPGHLSWHAGRESVRADLRLAGTPGQIVLSGFLSRTNGIDATLTLTDVNSRGWLADLGVQDLDFSGLDATFGITGAVEAPQARLTASTAQLHLPDTPGTLTASVDGRYAAGRLEIRHLKAEDVEGRHLSLSGHLPMVLQDPLRPVPGELRLVGRLKASDLGMVRTFVPAFPFEGGVLDVDLDLAGTRQAPIGSAALQIRELQPRPASGLPAGRYEATGRLDLQPGRLVITPLSVEGPSMQLRIQGLWDGLPAIQPWPPGRRQRALGKLDMNAALKVDDLHWVARQVPGLRRTAGAIDAHLAVSGPLREPRVRAGLKLGGGEIQTEADLPALRALQADLEIESRQVQIRELRGEIGGAPFHAEGRLDRADSGWTGDLHLQGQNLLLFRSEGLRMRADVDLTLSGNRTRPLLGGKVALTNGVFSRSIDYLGGLRPGGAGGRPGLRSTVLFPDPPLRDLRLDVQLGARNPFEIRTAHLRGRLVPDLHLGGTGQFPEISGRVRVEGAKLWLPGGVLDFGGGAIIFDRALPEEARLNLRGTGRMFEHDVTVLVGGTPAEPQITLSSVPPLPGDTLTMMILTGTPPPRGNQGSNSNAEMKLAVFVGRDILNRLFEEDEAESWGQVLDRFEVEMGRGITRSGEETINARFRLADNVWREGDTIYITGERDVFDDYNAGLRLVLRFK